LLLDVDAFRERLQGAARILEVERPPDLMVEGWWEQAHTLHEE